MALHYTDVRGTLVSFLAEVGLIEPSVEATAVDPAPPLSPEQQLLVECWQSGQIEPGAWQRHLDEDPVLAAHFQKPIVTH